MSLLQTMLPATMQNFAATTALDIAKNNGNSKSSWIDNISKYINGASGWLNKGVESANTAIGGLLDKGALNAEKFAPTSLAMGLGKSAVNATLGAFGNNPADVHSTAGKITQGLEELPLEMLGPWGIAAKGALMGFNIFDNALGKTGKLQGTKGMNITGYNQDINPLEGKKFSWTSNSKRKRSNKLTDVYMGRDTQAGFATYNQNQNSLAATNTTGSLYNKNALQKQGGLGTGSFLAKKGGTINPAQLRNIVYKAQKGAKLKKVEIEAFKEGGKMNVIPEGALHARKHDLPEEIAEQVTKKGIPVVTEEEGGKLTQHAEIERDEIIFHKEATNTIEDYFKKYNEAKTTKEKDKIALECGKYLTSEILTNTDDRTGLLEIIK